MASTRDRCIATLLARWDVWPDAEQVTDAVAEVLGFRFGADGEPNLPMGYDAGKDSWGVRVLYPTSGGLQWADGGTYYLLPVGDLQPEGS